MEQIKLTTISARHSEEEDSDEESASLPPSLSTLTVSENSETIDDKEWLLKNKHISAKGFSRRSGEHAEEDLCQASGSRRGNLKYDNSENITKMWAMACACTFGVGSHFASHIIGPMKGILMETQNLIMVILLARYLLKKQLDLTNTQFSLLIASITLCNTVIPIVSGLLVAKFGTTRSSLVITSIILLGMMIFTAASWDGKVGFMIVGFIVFGMGLAPLTIVQETIIASFVATVLAVPLSLMEPFTYRTPFIVATITCAMSWIMNIVYVFLLNHADNKKNHRKEGIAMHSVVEKKTCSNIIKHRFDTTDMLAAWDSSIILLLPVILYPFLGLFLDKYGFRLWILIFGSAGISITYLLLLLPPHMIHPFPPLFLFAVAFTAVPLTMVTLIPLLTKHVSTGLGLLKSVDNIGATLCQTFAGLLLDEHVRRKKYIIDDKGIEYGHENDDLVALRMFAILGSILFLVSLIFWWMDKTYKRGILNTKYEGDYNHDHDNTNSNNYGQLRNEEDDEVIGMEMICMEDETPFVKVEYNEKRKRTIVYMCILCLILIICWTVFGVVAFEKAGKSALSE
ncbi:13373_t:CDS:2 [Funneliformis geosporum]|uniref:Lysosomal dipeptide transporter MFSD1 n=1 Tax=Funneliformis geosporum TaxID=1117311 RepID=A0A9W4SJG7_9GLOM|nr:13373_t:CDS:2 [Funneliformis geosporum]